MSRFTSLLQETFLRKKETPKEVPERAALERLPILSNLFQVDTLGEREQAEIASILKDYAEEGQAVERDLSDLIAITQEVRAITNQAVILHGERIKRAQHILKRYRDGAFSAWLIATYGNRQTPYNFLQYHEFYSQMPKQLHPQIEAMPRQAIYTLASRNGSPALKEEIVRKYNGETKQQLIRMIRDHFPLAEHDKRKEDLGEGAVKILQKLTETLRGVSLTTVQKQHIEEQLRQLKGLLQ